MKVVIAIDSFKGSLSSVRAGNAAAEGIKRVFTDAETIVLPVADGGEGTAEALVSGLNGKFRSISVLDPLGRSINAAYGILPDGTAVIEMAAASGLTLLAEEERDPMHTTTYGTGQMIRDAAEQGCRSFIIGIGGSATNDGGIGCLQALGFGMLGADGKQVCFGAEGLSKLTAINDNDVLPQLRECSFRVACDVGNPLCGGNGCSAVFARQKGADDDDTIKLMDSYMERYAQLTKGYCPAADPDTAGSGAAGGLGFALMYYLNARLVSGIDLVIQASGMEKAVQSADIVVTGEGCIDSQTAMGKAPAGIAALAKKYGKPVIAFCGAAGSGDSLCNEKGIDAFFPVLRQVSSAEEAMDSANAARNLADTAEQVFRIIKSFR